MSFRDWFEYVLKRAIWYVETPREKRKEIKKTNREYTSTRWFGMLPFSMKMAYDQVGSRLRKKKQ